MTTIRANQIEMYYQSTGQGDPLIFIHGLGSSAGDWDLQEDYFSKSFQVISYDVRGHGQSEKAPGPYSVPLFSKDLAALMDALEIEQAHIVGLSMGGWIAFQFAVDHPERLKSLTIVHAEPDLKFETKERKKELRLRLILFTIFSMRKIGKTLAPRLFIKPEQEELRQTFIENWAKNHKPSYMAAFRGAVGWSVADRIGEINVPTLVLTADEDYATVEAKEAFTKQIPNAELVVIEDARHALPVEKPDEFNQALEEFLNKVKSV